jgi:acetylglutamate kinase
MGIAMEIGKLGLSAENFGDDALRAEAADIARRYAGKNVVVKYGGAAMSDEARKNAVMCELALLSQSGVRLTLVHGGGPEIDAALKKIGKAPVFIDGLRQTDAETMEVVCMVLAGKVNKGLVGLLHAAGAFAVGLCGADGAMLRVEKCRPARRGAPDLGFVGEIKHTDATLPETLLSAGFIPVISSIGADDRGALFNVNADTAAAALAGALRAETLILMTDVKGVFADANDEDSLFETLHAGEARALIARGVVRGGMIPKVLCCVAAVEDGGLEAAAVVDGRVPHALLRALSADGGCGTRFVR